MSQSIPFGRYLLLELLAEGGMAQVYRAVLRDASGFEKRVALKRMRSELCSDPDFITRFIDEARIASTLSHGNIAQVFDFGEVDGEHYLTMELVDGPDLGTLMAACRAQQQPVPIPTATYIVAEAAYGLGAAHRRLPSPVVHRDVSPQNVLISRSGEVKMVDFGIALAAEKVLRTRTGLVLGKCRYMAPEQARGETLDPRADVFAAASVLFELLAGAPLFDADSAEHVIKQLLSAPIPLLSSRNPDVPPELDEILVRALDRRREARPANGGVLARELEALLHHMAPDFSPEDLAALVNATVPPRVRRASWDAVVTAPEAQQLAMLETALLDRAAQSAPSPESAAITGPAPVGRAAAPVSWEPPSVLIASQADGASAAAKTTGPAGPAPRQPLSARAVYLTTLFVVAAGLLGAALGTASGFFFRRAARTTLAVGATVEHAGWRLRLEQLGRGGGSLLVRLRVWPGAAAGSRPTSSPWAARPRLQLNGAEILPSFASTVARDDGQEWRLAFPLDRAEHAPILELRPPGARPWLLTLIDSAR